MKPKFLSKIALIFLLLCNSYVAVSQTQFSENGYILPVSGTVRILIVYAQVDNGGVNCTTFGDDNQWPQGQAPKWAEGDASLNMPRMFDYNYSGSSSITPGSYTDYYYQASCGKLIVLADYINLVFNCNDPLL